MQIKKGRRIASVIILILGFAMIVAGIFRGEVLTVLNKATKICLECIGIG
ncbi:CD1871A family CXXC motif-containing protein [Treponema sp. C6A8]|nr:CD1871A family CXXC motif-containing protein [Treponema sp. C6A8]